MPNLLLDVCYVHRHVIIAYCCHIERNPSANFVYTGCGGRVPDAASAAAQRRWVSRRKDSIPSDEDIRYRNWDDNACKQIAPISEILFGFVHIFMD